MLYERELGYQAKTIREKAKELQEVIALKMRVSDFQKIDPEDVVVVMEIISGARFRKFREQPISEDAILSEEEEADLATYMQHVLKYQMRAFGK